jgi:hypothetical protein
MATPVGDIVVGGRKWRQVFLEDFNTDVAVGGFTPQTSGALTTGAAAAAYGGRLTVYPSGWNASTYGKSRPEKVLSVSNSCLVYDLKVDSVTGEAMAATVHYNAPLYYLDPAIGARVEVRFKVINAPNLLGWGGVVQLIPSDAEWAANHGELDVIEGDLASNMETNQHWYGAPNVFTRWGSQPYGNNVFHTATTDWVPVGDPAEPAGRETVTIDGVKIGESLGDRIARNQRALIAFQTGVNSVPPSTGGGQLLVDYVAVWVPDNGPMARMAGGLLTIAPPGAAARMAGGTLTAVQLAPAARMAGGTLSSPGAVVPGRYRYDLATATWKPVVRYRYNLATTTWQARPYGA